MGGYAGLKQGSDSLGRCPRLRVVGVFDGPVQVFEEGLCRFECGEGLFQHVVLHHEGLARCIDEAVGAVSEVGRIGFVAGKPVRDPFEPPGFVQLEERGFAERQFEVALSVTDVFAQDTQGLGRKLVVARGQHVSAGVFVGILCPDLEIIARKAGLFALRANESAHVGLVRALVGGEAGVAVDAVGAVFCCQSFDAFVEFGDARNQLFCKCVEFCLGVYVFLLMLLEPVPTVVFIQPGEEIDDAFQIVHGVLSLSFDLFDAFYGA